MVNRQRVFAKKGNFEAFLAALAELKERKPFELYGYCLLDNHFHLLIRPRGAPISRIMQSRLISHTSGLQFGNPAWIERLTKKLDLDLAIRPRGRPRKALSPTNTK